MKHTKRILVVGATGYIGGRLVSRLLDDGWTVRVAVRNVEKAMSRPWSAHGNLEIVQSDILDRESIEAAATDCFAVYYLVHSMGGHDSNFSSVDRKAAINMVHAANKNNIERIIYLSGLGNRNDALSEHLKSRAETAEILALSSAKLTCLRAAMILGSGSASFEILRYLADRLPVMVTPRWVDTRTQPIAVSNVLTYLVGCLNSPVTAGKVYDIGGPDVLSFAEMFQLYAQVCGLRKRIMIRLPFISPGLSSHWLNLITPVPISIARPLVDGLRNETVCEENSIREIIPQELLSVSDTFKIALQKVDQKRIDTCWHDAGQTLPAEWTVYGDPSYSGGQELQCGYRCLLAAEPNDIWPVISGIGGESGWYAFNSLWKIRGWIDKIIGGVGLRRGRRDPKDIFEQDALDFWRVLKVDPEVELVLQAEMKLPGEALLEFILIRKGENKTELIMLSHFLPKGLAGLIYWYAVYPLHHLVFSGMLKKMAEASLAQIISGPERYTPVWRNAARCLFKTNVEK
jgi:uncharacterized protein YbjT (DUF2867 family)